MLAQRQVVRSNAAGFRYVGTPDGTRARMAIRQASSAVPGDPSASQGLWDAMTYTAHFYGGPLDGQTREQDMLAKWLRTPNQSDNGRYENMGRVVEQTDRDYIFRWRESVVSR